MDRREASDAGDAGHPTRRGALRSRLGWEPAAGHRQGQAARSGRIRLPDLQPPRPRANAASDRNGESRPEPPRRLGRLRFPIPTVPYRRGWDRPGWQQLRGLPRRLADSAAERPLARAPGTRPLQRRRLRSTEAAAEPRCRPSRVPEHAALPGGESRADVSLPLYRRRPHRRVRARQRHPAPSYRELSARVRRRCPLGDTPRAQARGSRIGSRLIPQSVREDPGRLVQKDRWHMGQGGRRPCREPGGLMTMQLGKTLSETQIEQLVAFLDSLTGKIPENFATAVALPA